MWQWGDDTGIVDDLKKDVRGRPSISDASLQTRAFDDGEEAQ
jgi:hypothetical protein